MTTLLVLETDGVRARLSCLDRSSGELALVIPNLEADIELDSESWGDLDAIELRVKDSDIEVEQCHIGMVLIGVPPRAAEKLQFPTKINHSAAIDVQGAVQSPLDETLLRSQLAGIMQTHSPPRAWSVSGMNSHRNPGPSKEQHRSFGKSRQKPPLRAGSGATLSMLFKGPAWPGRPPPMRCG